MVAARCYQRFAMQFTLQETDDVARNRVIRTMARKQAINDRLDAAMIDDGKSVVVCLDLTWCDMMNNKVSCITNSCTRV